jgi:DnaJ-class molecular chaperone
MSAVSTHICPNCDGTGHSRILDMTCNWCHGNRKVDEGCVINYSNMLEVISTGGYFDGTHDYNDMAAMKEQAKNLRSVLSNN